VAHHQRRRRQKDENAHVEALRGIEMKLKEEWVSARPGQAEPLKTNNVKRRETEARVRFSTIGRDVRREHAASFFQAKEGGDEEEAKRGGEERGIKRPTAVAVTARRNPARLAAHGLCVSIMSGKRGGGRENAAEHSTAAEALLAQSATTRQAHATERWK
jgi:hypothetical protein